MLPERVYGKKQTNFLANPTESYGTTDAFTGPVKPPGHVFVISSIMDHFVTMPRAYLNRTKLDQDEIHHADVYHQYKIFKCLLWVSPQPLLLTLGLFPV